MALPPGVSGKTLTFGTTTGFDGIAVPAGSRVTITTSKNVKHLPSGRQLVAGPIVRKYIDGIATFDELVPNDADGLDRRDWVYTVRFEIAGANESPESFSFVLFNNDPQTIDGDLLSPVPSSIGTPVSVNALRLPPGGVVGQALVFTADFGVAWASLQPAGDYATNAVVKAGVVVHGADATVARPATTNPVVWFGTVDPVNADDTKDVTVPLGLDDGTGLHIGVSDSGVAALVADPASSTGVALRAALVPFWAPSEVVTAGKVRMTADGHTIVRISNGTTRSTYDATEAALWTVVSGSGGTAGAAALTPTATKTAAYTVAAGELAVMNVAGGATALTLPTAPADKAQVGFRAVGATSAAPLVVSRGGTDTIGDSGATSVTLPLAGEVTVYQYQASSTRWLPVANVKPLTALDGRYDAAGAAAATVPDAVVFVTSAGSDSNDGRTPGKAKATIAAALAAGKATYANGFTVQLGYGTFSADTFPIVIDATMPGVTIRGCGMGQTYDPTNNVTAPTHPTTIKNNADTDTFQITGPTILGPTGGAVQYGVRIEDLAVVGAAGTAGSGLNVTNCPRMALRRVAIDQHGAWGLSITNSFWIGIDTVVATRNGNAAATTPTGGLQLVYPANLIPITNSIFNYNTGAGAYLNSGSAIAFHGCDFSKTLMSAWSGSGRGVASGGVGPYSYLGCWFESNTAGHMKPITAGGSHTFLGCYFEGNGLTPYAFGTVGSTDKITIFGGRFGGHSSHWSIDGGGTVPGSIIWGNVTCLDTSGWIQGPGNNSSVNVLASSAASSGRFGAAQTSSVRVQTLATAGTVAINAAAGDLQVINLQANATSSTITGAALGQVLTITFVQDATGGRTYAYPTNMKFAGGVAPSDTTASKQTTVTIRYDGASWQEVSRAVAVG